MTVPGDEPERDATDPAAIRSLAVSADDVANAFVYSRENPGEAVLRVTPPFHGRMRARLHVDHDPELDADDGAVRVDPGTLLADAVVDDYPTLEAIEADLAAEAETGSDDLSPARIGEAHADALENWHDRAVESIVDAATLETPAGAVSVDVVRLE